MVTKKKQDPDPDPNAPSLGTPPSPRPRPGQRPRGRPPGRTEQGEATRAKLYEAALRLMASEGYAATTLRKIAGEAGVSHALLYRYFPSKGAVVLALYEHLSADYVDATQLPKGRWRARTLTAFQGSLTTLAPHRETLRGAMPVLISATDGGVFSASARFSLERVRSHFLQAVAGATDAPKPARAATLGRLFYLAHLGVTLTWLLDRSPKQRASNALLSLLKTALPLVAAALKLPGVWKLLERADKLFEDALLERLPSG